MKTSSTRNLWLASLAIGVALIMGYFVGDAVREPLLAPPPENISAPASGVVLQEEEEEVEMEMGAASERRSVTPVKRLDNANLHELYNAQRMYQVSTGRYTTDLRMLGWSPLSPLMRFKLGFLSPSNDPSGDPTRMDTNAFLSVLEPQSGTPYVYSVAAEGIELSHYADLCRQGCTADARGFEVLIAVPLDAEGHIDVWTFNHRHELMQVWDGINGEPVE